MSVCWLGGIFFVPPKTPQSYMAIHCCLFQVDEELEALLENGEGLTDEKEVLSLCRLMVRVETMEQKLTCLKLIQVSCPALFRGIPALV